MQVVGGAAEMHGDTRLHGREPPPVVHGRRPRMQPRSTRRAIAFAIELERTHDRLCAQLGHSMPLGCRISALDSTTSRARPLSLPPILDARAVNALIAERAEAIEEVADLLDQQMDAAEGQAVRTIIEQARQWSRAERKGEGAVGVRAARRDLMNNDWWEARRRERAEEEARRSSLLVWEPVPARPEAYAIDLMLDGLLRHHGIDRERLHDEIGEIAREADGRSVELASAAMRSNTARTLRTLGGGFPPALLRLRGGELATLELRIEDAGPDDGSESREWTYATHQGAPPTMTRMDALRGEKIHEYARRPLAEIIRHPGIHWAILVKNAERVQMAGLTDYMTRLHLFPRYAHLDPPNTPAHTRPPITAAIAPDDVTARDVEVNDIIGRHLYARDRANRFRLTRTADGDYALSIGERLRPHPFHRHLIKAEDVGMGRLTIERRVDDIIVLIEEAEERRRALVEQQLEIEEQERQKAERKLLQAEKRRLAAERERLKKQRIKEGEARLSAAIAALGSAKGIARATTLWREDGADLAWQFVRARSADAMLRTLLDTEWSETGEYRKNHVKLIVESGIIGVASAVFGHKIRYQRKQAVRVGGEIRHIVGTFHLLVDVTDKWIESRRDGVASDIFNWDGDLGQSQIQRISRNEHGIEIDVRLRIAPIG